MTRTIDVDLRYDRDMLEEVAEYAPEWDQLPETWRAAVSIDWDQAMGSRLRFLDEQYQAGTMAPEQRVGYEALLRQLKALLPTIRRLGLWEPPIPLKAKA